MNVKTFFFILFFISIALCIGSTVVPNMLENIIFIINPYYKINTTFLGLLSLITAIISYLGWLTSTYFGTKREKKRLDKEERDRLNIEAIHKEIQALHKAQ